MNRKTCGIFFKNDFLAMMHTKKIPNITDLELTNNCNLHCVICTANKRKKWEMQIDFLEKILNKNQKILEGKNIWLHFRGEPLLYKNLCKAIDLLNSYWVKSSFSTNGILLTDSNIRKILTSKVHRIVVSMITDIPSEYKRLRWVDALWIVKNNALKLKEAIDKKKSDTIVQVMFLDHGQDKNHIKRFVDSYRKLGFEVSVHKYSHRTGEVKWNMSVDEYNGNPKRKPCHRLFQKTCLLRNWDIVPCCYDMEGKVFSGFNIRDYDFDLMKARESKIYKDIRSKQNKWIYEGNCNQCKDRMYEHPQIGKRKNSRIRVYPAK